MNNGRKITGGKYVAERKMKKFERPGQGVLIKLGATKRKAKIKNVLETPSNRFLARQNVLTKGTIVDTDLGKVKITNRPTQEGVVNGILLE